MNVNKLLSCRETSCEDIDREGFTLPDVEINVDKISIVMISESAPPQAADYYIRGRGYKFRGGRAFPSYLQAGPSFFIEKSKRRMIAEDIEAALKLI